MAVSFSSSARDKSHMQGARLLLRLMPSRGRPGCRHRLVQALALFIAGYVTDLAYAMLSFLPRRKVRGNEINVLTEVLHDHATYSLRANGFLLSRVSPCGPTEDTKPRSVPAHVQAFLHLCSHHSSWRLFGTRF